MMTKTTLTTVHFGFNFPILLLYTQLCRVVMDDERFIFPRLYCRVLRTDNYYNY